MTIADLEAENRHLRDMAIRLAEELVMLLRKRRGNGTNGVKAS